MTGPIPAEVMEEARKISRLAVSGLPFKTDRDIEAQVGFVSGRIAAALLAAEKRGEQRERERAAKIAELAVGPHSHGLISAEAIAFTIRSPT